MYLLRRNETRSTVPFWDDVSVDAEAPIALRLLVSRDQVMCDAAEAEQALAWARKQRSWTDHPPPVRVIRSGAAP
jgi:hypothetical protein